MLQRSHVPQVGIAQEPEQASVQDRDHHAPAPPAAAVEVRRPWASAPTRGGLVPLWVSRYGRVVSRKSDLAESVALVAIGSLGGPGAAAGVATKEVAKHLKKAYDGRSADPGAVAVTRLHETIRTAASAGEVTADAVDRGLMLAQDVIAAAGMTTTGMAQWGYDPAKIATEVIAVGRAREPVAWGGEVHYEIAERTIRETYAVLVELAQQDATLSLVLALWRDVSGRLPGQLTAADVQHYLTVRMGDWDRSVLGLGDRRPIDVARRLRVQPSSDRPKDALAGQLVDEADALAGQAGLVVLGGPGSGKTWLAHRYARSAAQQALTALQSGADLSHVEIPVYATWAQWAHHDLAGSPREQLIRSALARGSDLGGAEVVDRLAAGLAASGMRILAVVDSLDEAAAVVGQASRWRELTSISGWRVVVTSRPAAWRATIGASDSAAPEWVRVVTVQDLTYPDDVDDFIDAWFTTTAADTADHLKHQIRGRRDLQASATIPLLLTFYCLITESSTHGPGPGEGGLVALPRFRRDLYTRIVRRLLRGGWTTPAGLHTGPDVERLATILATWAFEAATTQTDPYTGLGAWTEDFDRPARAGLSSEELTAVERVAPIVRPAGDDDIREARRFVHRTIFEHLVAEHIATQLSTEQAFEVLLPHLWFDPDWDVTAPVAIVAHQHRGDVLSHILDYRTSPGPDDTKRMEANQQIDALLVAVATESDPTDWPQHLQETIVDSLTNAAGPTDLARAKPWTQRYPRITQTLLERLTTADPSTAAWIAEQLVALTPTETERTHTRQALLEHLTTADPWDAARIAEQLVALTPTETERTQTRQGLIDRATYPRILRSFSTAAEWTNWLVGP